MEHALYAPGLGYYSRGDRQFGNWPDGGSDFVTAPELSPLFAAALARQVRQALHAVAQRGGRRELWEFGAGSGALAAGLLQALGDEVERYTIVDLSAALQTRQRATVAERVPDQAHKLSFADCLPAALCGVVVGNEVLDAMPVALLHFDGSQWWERGVVWSGDSAAPGCFAWQNRPTDLRPPVDAPFVPGTTIELPRQAEAYTRTLAAALARGGAGLALFIDYGFPQAEFYLPQRSRGTLACHRRHRVDFDPLTEVGEKDLTAHVDFTAMALAAQEAGAQVLGYTSQARFLMNCGLLEDLPPVDPGSARAWAVRAAAQKLLTEHEMGELFKVLAYGCGLDLDLLGFAQGDRLHTL